VVPDQDGALAAVLLHRRTHRREYVVQRLALGLGEAEGMVEVDAGDLQRLRVDGGSRRGFDMGAGRLAKYQRAVVVDVEWYRGDFEQGVAVPVEAAGFHVHHHGQVAAEAAGERGDGGRGRSGLIHARSLAERLAGPDCDIPCTGAWGCTALAFQGDQAAGIRAPDRSGTGAYWEDRAGVQRPGRSRL